MYFKSSSTLVESIIRQTMYALGRADDPGDQWQNAYNHASGIYYPDVVRGIMRGESTPQGVKLVMAVMLAVDEGKQHIYFVDDSDATAPGEVISRWRDINIVTSDSPLSVGQLLDINMSWLRQQIIEPEGEDGDGDLDIQAQDNILIIRPTQEALQVLPASARQFALRIGVASTGRNSEPTVNLNDDLTYTVNTGSGRTIEGGMPTAAQLIEEARVAYRQWLRATMGRNVVDAEDIAKREAARRASAERFAAFSRRPVDETRHVPTLPFVPHGLSSSRRWGIEVESGGARGVQAPDQWRRIGDSSIRSAWDGYKEVQDFEPFDEEVTEFVRPANCDNWRQHQYETEEYNSVTDQYEYNMNPDYMDPAECQLCGPTTRIEHRVPQTITHRAQRDDCGEFVSPILVSMHSNGLASLTEQLAKQPQNSSSGVHVHVEASDLTNEQVATLIFGYDMLEPLLESSYQRGETRRYCARRSPEDVLKHARKLRSRQAISNREVRGGDRYVTLNTNALDEHGTIEFRAMGAVYDYDYLVRWAMLCRELVNLAAAGVTTKQFTKVKTWNDLTMLLAEYGKEYMRAAVYEATGEVGVAADLVKRGAEVTTEALNTDLNTIMAQWQTMSDSISASAIRAGTSVHDLASRLVGVGSASVSNTWMV